jgi:O-antigen ligase
MTVRIYYIVFFVAIGSIFGFPFLAGFSATFGLPNTPLSLALRGGIALASIFIVLSNINTKSFGLGAMLLICNISFIIFYIFRLIYSTLLFPEVTSAEALEYWIWSIGASFLPVLALSLSKSYNFNFSEFYSTSFFVVFIASILVFINMSGTVVDSSQNIYDSGRARLGTLNPISLGHLGASLFLLSIAGFWRRGRSRTTINILLLAGIALGGLLLLSSNSRGPLLSVAAAMIFLLLVLRAKYKLIISLSLFVAAILFVPALRWIEYELGYAVYSRLFDQSISEEVNVVARLGLYEAAIGAFSESPFFGAGFGVEGVGAYPHNTIIEAFLTVGVLGGFAFLLAQVIALIIAWRLARARSDLVWLSMITVQYIVASQFSGSIYASPSMWAVIGVMGWAYRTLLVNRQPKTRHG